MNAIEGVLWMTLGAMCAAPVMFFLGAVGAAMKIQADLRNGGLSLQYVSKLQKWRLMRMTEKPVSANDATIH